MSGASEDRKRELTPEPEVQRKKGKHDGDSENDSDDEDRDTPKTGKTHPSILLQSAMMMPNAIHTSPIKSVENLHSLISKLDDRVTAQEEELIRVKTQLSDKDKTIATLREKLEKQRIESEKNGIALEGCLKAEDLQQLKQDLAEASEGIASLETFKGECETRINFLEQQVTVTGTGTLDGTNLVNAEDKVAKIQQELNDHIASMGDFKLNQGRENRKRHLEREQQEQYSRRDCVVVKGVPSKRGEDTNDLICRIAYSIGVMISPGDISVSHRMGRQVGNQPRPIICKFTRRETKYTLLRNRYATRHIKDDGEGHPVRIFIDENLTSMRAKVCKKLREDKTPHTVKDGKIILNGEDSTPKVLDSPNDWENLDWPVSVKVELGIYPRE